MGRSHRMELSVCTFSKMIKGKTNDPGSQFDASKGGLAGKVEKAVDGPRNPASGPDVLNK